MVAQIPRGGASVRCTAKSKRSGRQCEHWAAPGRTVCHIHGGKTPQGVAASRFVDGRYSKALPTHLLSRYQTAAADPDLLVQRAEVALIDTRLAELVTRLGDADNASRWGTVRLAFSRYCTALADAENSDEPDTVLLTARLGELHAAIHAGQDDTRVWSDIGEQIEARRKVVESERKRLVELQQMITVEQLLLVLAQVAGTVRAHVKDRTALSAISTDLARLSSAEALAGYATRSS